MDQVKDWVWYVSARERHDAMAYLDKSCVAVRQSRAERSSSAGNVTDTVYELVSSGPSYNRIDVVFMGDGYTASMEQKFLADMTRLTGDMFEAVTFHSYLPLFNIWAVFRPSDDAGIGKNSEPRNTSYGLYRDGTELRGIYCSKPDAAIDSCKHTGPHACDYPTLIGNNPFYGGLGGEFSISTSSHNSGIVVLRHEFGHSMGDVGEEYDSGMHFGANVAYSMQAATAKWGPWLSYEGEAHPEQSAQLIQDYSWYLLENGPYTLLFNSTGDYDRWKLQFSVSGCPAEGSLEIFLDGKTVQWETQGLLDRTFYTIYTPEGFSKGSHNLTFAQGFPPTHQWPHRQLCSVNLIEYKDEPEFHFDNSYVSAYPTFNDNNQAFAYRSQNERCLMRNMTSNEFCHADKENLWLQYLARVSLIDSLSYQCHADEVVVSLDVVPLGQFRSPPATDGEEFTCSWTKDGVSQPDLDNKFKFALPRGEASGMYEVKVHFSTPEVRSDPQQLLTVYDSIHIIGC